MPSVACHHNKGFVISIKHHGVWTKIREYVKNMKKDEKTVAQIYTGRGEEKTLYVFPEWTSRSLLPLALLEEATKPSRLLGDRNKGELVDSMV